MPENQDLVPQPGGPITTGQDGKPPVVELFDSMSRLTQSALAALLTRNVQNAEVCSLGARALYEEARQDGSIDQTDLQLLKILQYVVTVYAPLVRVMAFQLEGDFDAALDSIPEALTISENAIRAVEEYAGLPSTDHEIVQVYQPMLSIFPIIFTGSDASIRAEMVGYQGNIPEYRKLLQKAVAEFRKVRDLPPSANPVFVALFNICADNEARLKKRIQNFKSKKGPIYVPPVGDKVFIIHGHDEAKWRELKDLLQSEFKLEAVVLKEQAGTGRTLIEKLEHFANDCCYAFALLTPDDVVEMRGKRYLQARPNVLFELGWFYGHFGRERVCIIKKETTKMPSDLEGIGTIDFNKEISEKVKQIRIELINARIV